MNTEWIVYKERHPVSSEYYLVWTGYCITPEIMKYMVDEQKWYKGMDSCHDPIAWMPLPHPYVKKTKYFKFTWEETTVYCGDIEAANYEEAKKIWEENIASKRKKDGVGDIWLQCVDKYDD